MPKKSEYAYVYVFMSVSYAISSIISWCKYTNNSVPGKYFFYWSLFQGHASWQRSHPMV